jgi:hypothetical protein
VLKLWHLLTVLGVSLVLVALPVSAVERTGGGALRSSTKVDVQIETINTFIQSVTTRLKKDINDELGYDTDCTSPTDDDCRIYRTLQTLQARVNSVEQRLLALPTDKIYGVESDSFACRMAKETAPSGCDPATHRMIWQVSQGNPGAWKCVPKAIWETP